MVYLGNSPTPTDSSQILIRRDHTALAAAIRELLGVGTVAVAADPTPRVDYTVIIGLDWKPPAGWFP